MNLIEEAVIIEVFGIRVYAFGAYVALGAVCAVIVMAALGRAFRFRAGSIHLTALLSMACGLICSRIAFCLLNQELGMMMPLSAWPQVSGGGWSMFGMISGVYLGGWLSAMITKEESGRVADILSLAMLPMIAAERMGESRIEGFDISRSLDIGFLHGTFLAVGEDDPVLATYYVAAAAAIVLFAVLIGMMLRHPAEAGGRLAVRFLLLFGAVSIILESLRYDFFLSISFVGLQQITAAAMLLIGVILAARRSKTKKTALKACAFISLALMVGIIIGLEFALDRTTWNKPLIYAAMILTVSVPAALGLRLLNGREKGNALP